jgi:hypothetical protein
MKIFGGMMVHCAQNAPPIFISFGTVVFNLPEGILSGKVIKKVIEIESLFIYDDGYTKRLNEAV